jgi:O-antigen ligase
LTGIVTDEISLPTQSAPKENALALVLCAGVALSMLVVLSFKVFELDRYFVPKELVLNIAGLVVTLMIVARPRLTKVDTVDALLIVFLVWSFVSAFFATNHWVAQRAFAVSFASAAIFWGARRAAAANAQRLLLVSAAVAGVIAAITSLAQAYGFETDWFTLARSPGGTLGNRNFIAHVVAISLPVVIWCTVAAKRPFGALIGSIGVGVLSATLVLSRSRAAWLAVAAFIAVTAIPLLASRKYWKDSPVGGRLARILLTAFIVGAIAVVIPNTLEWNSDSPYLDSAKNVVDYSSGSGRGRLAQYRNSLGMAMDNPIFGVAPGNWPVRYQRYAPGGDKSLAESGMTANPWPSSDWVAFVSERGAVAAVALLGVFALLFLGSLRRWSELGNPDAVLLRLALAGTIVTTMVVSLFDAVLLLPAPAFLVWMILGAAACERRSGRVIELEKNRRRVISFAVIAIALMGAVRSATQTMAMVAVGTGGRTAGWVSGANWDPGSYRINQRVAEIYANRGKCGKARPYVRQALDLFPSSPPARRLARRCGLKR